MDPQGPAHNSTPRRASLVMKQHVKAGKLDNPTSAVKTSPRSRRTGKTYALREGKAGKSLEEGRPRKGRCDKNQGGCHACKQHGAAVAGASWRPAVRAPLPTDLARVLHVVLLAALGAAPGAGAGGALLRATQHDGVLVQVPAPLHCDADRPRCLTDVVARNTQKGGLGAGLGLGWGCEESPCGTPVSSG